MHIIIIIILITEELRSAFSDFRSRSTKFEEIAKCLQLYYSVHRQTNRVLY
jgi:hypothetical protein